MSEIGDEQLDLEIRRHWCEAALTVRGSPRDEYRSSQSCGCGNTWPCVTLAVVQGLTAARDAERERRRLNVRRAWEYRHQWEQAIEAFARQVERVQELTAERDVAIQRAERLLAGLRGIEFGNLDPSDANDPAWSWCYYCDGRNPGHEAACPLAALIRDAEGA